MKKRPERVVLIASGGLDSSVLLYALASEGLDVMALSFDYGQRHRREILAASQIALAAHVDHRIVDLRSLGDLLKGSSLTDPSITVPHGHYTAESMKATVVPNRNMIMLSIAAGWAISLKAPTVAYAAHSGDHAIYHDCREEFVRAVEGAISLADEYQVSLRRPFISMTKAEIVLRGQQLEVPFHLTYSCYEGEAAHCGNCGTCVERREAFRLAGVPDPTRYSD